MVSIYQELADTICRPEERMGMVSTMKEFIEGRVNQILSVDYEDASIALTNIRETNGRITYELRNEKNIVAALKDMTHKKLTGTTIIFIKCNASLGEVNDYLEHITEDISAKSIFAIASDDSMPAGELKAHIWN